MQKLLFAVLASTASAEEHFLAKKAALDQDMTNLALNFDVNPDSILPCQYFTETAVFNFQNVLDRSQVGSAIQTTLLQDYTFTGASTAQTTFNWCETKFAASQSPLTDIDAAKCVDSSQKELSSNAFIAPSATQCEATNPEKDSNAGDTAGFEIMNSDGAVIGITLAYQGQTCNSATGEKYSLNVTAMCPADGKANKDAPKINGTPSVSDSGCHFDIVYETGNGCPVFSLSQVSIFFDKYYYLFGAFLIVVGLFLAMLGNKFVNVVIFMVSAFALLILGSWVFINYALEKVTDQTIVWVVFIVIALVSMGGGLLLVKFRKYGIGLFAAWGGALLGFVVTNTFAVSNKYAFYAIIVAGAIGMFFIAIKIEKTVIILLTAFIGSYAFVRGISLYAGGFPNETEFHAELAAGVIKFDTMPKWYYAYLGGILLMFIISTVHQFKNNQKGEKKRAELKTFMK